MRVVSRHRKTIVLLCGAIVAVTAIFAPQGLWGEGGGEPCEEPWRSVCIMDQENCIDCDSWCKSRINFPEDDCEKESSFCDLDTLECDPDGDFPFYEMCTCKESGWS